MSIAPTSFAALLNPEGTTTEEVTIGNYGAARLDFTVASAAEWLYPDAWTGTVEPGADSVIALTFDASGLGVGTYQSNLILRSNQHLAPLLQPAQKLFPRSESAWQSKGQRNKQ